MASARRFPRAPLKIPVLYGPGELTHRGWTHVIGEGGMYLEGEKVFYKGTGLILQFRLPGHPADTVTEGRVVWTIVKGTYGVYRGPGMGIEFIGIDQRSRESIKQYVQEKKEILEKILYLLDQTSPPVKEINDLLTRTYIKDYKSFDDLRQQVRHHLKYFEVDRPADLQDQ